MRNLAIRKILVAVRDPDANASPAVLKAARLARGCGAALELFHDLAEPIFVSSLDKSSGLKSKMRAASNVAITGLERLADTLRATGLTVHTCAHWDYPVYESVIRRALHTGADLIVTNCRARHRLPALLGYTDWSLLRDSPIPVLLVKNNQVYKRPKLLAAIDPSHDFSKPSGLDLSILREASRLGQALGASPHVINAYLPIPPAADDDLTSKDLALRIRSRARRLAARALKEALRGFDISAARIHLVEADPASAISATAHRIKASIVVMGAISRRGFKRIFVGNTAERVLDELPCDLLVVKPEGFTTNIPRASRRLQLILATTVR